MGWKGTLGAVVAVIGGILRGILRFIGEMFTVHMFARRASFFAAWFTILSIMAATIELAKGGFMNEHVASIFQAIILIAGGVVAYYHYRRP